MQKKFELVCEFQPSGDQPAAIAELEDSLNAGSIHQSILGVTGSGKTYAIAQLINRLQRPALIMAHNKTLAAQLYSEIKGFFPHNSIEYFVSYYDYYQPEAYVPTTDTFIEKDAAINEHIEQMRLSATKAILQRRDTVIVATVSAIYGLGDPEAYLEMVLHFAVGAKMSQREMIHRLANMQYSRNAIDFKRGAFRVVGDQIDVHPSEEDSHAVRVQLFDDEIERIEFFDPLTGEVLYDVPEYTLYPKTHYVSSRERINDAVSLIQNELEQHHRHLLANDKVLEAARIKQRTEFDLEMMKELGYCQGIENYSRYLSSREPGQPPPTLMNYLPDDALIVLDESHVTLPQIKGMYRGDRSRKETLVEYGFRMPSALDNRPLCFEEFEQLGKQMVYVSATPGPYETENSTVTAEMINRPTGLLDPVLEIRPALHQVDDFISAIQEPLARKERVLVTTLTKRMAEDLTDYLNQFDIRVRYLHSNIDTIERVEIIRDLRKGVFDVLVGINLLREGLDLPEVSLVAIFDADKQGFLRSATALIQTIGRAARNINGKVILYADKRTDAIDYAVSETKRRRKIQNDFNQEHGITPRSVQKSVRDLLTVVPSEEDQAVEKVVENHLSQEEIIKKIKQLDKEMRQAAQDLEFEKATALRDQIKPLKALIFR